MMRNKQAPTTRQLFASILLACTALTACIGLTACATNPATKQHDFVMLSEEQELLLGQKAAAEIEKTLPLMDRNDPLVRYVDSVGQKVAAVSDRPNLFYRFHVVDNADINAFALPGGYIYIHRGLLIHMNSEAELAAVLGHEIGHVTARHAVKQYSKAQAYQLGSMVASIFLPIPQGAGVFSDLMASAVLHGFGRDAELQADQLSIRYLSRAGYDPHATIGILQTLKRLEDISSKEKTDAGEKVEAYHGAFSTHPETAKRIEDAVDQAARNQAQTGFTNRNSLLAAINGAAYGDSAEQGAVVGRRFLHPGLGIQMRFPDDWVITNTPSELQARLRQKKVFFRFSLKELNKRQTASEILRSGFPKRHLSIIDTGTQVGMPFAHGEVNISAPHVGQAKIAVYVFLKGSQAYVMMMWSKRDEFYRYRTSFATIAHSLHSYSIARDGDIPRLALHIWKDTDSWAVLASQNHHILGRFTADKLAALNGMEITAKPHNGEVIKTVH